MMKITMSIEKLLEIIKRQINNIYYLNKNDENDIEMCLSSSLIRIEKCFERVRNKYYWENTDCGEKNVIFNPLHSCQYTIFLYYMSNELYKKTGNITLCDRIYGLNKMLSSADIFYAIELPEIFFCEHPVGSVMGRAKYGNYFAFLQGCTVGGNKGSYPNIGENVTMLSNSKVIGNSNIGNNVIISANTYIKDSNIPDYSIVFGQYPNLSIKKVDAEKIFELNNLFYIFK